MYVYCTCTGFVEGDAAYGGTNYSAVCSSCARLVLCLGVLTTYIDIQ